MKREHDLEPYRALADDVTLDELRKEVEALRRWRHYVDAALVELDFPYPHIFYIGD